MLWKYILTSSSKYINHSSKSKCQFEIQFANTDSGYHIYNTFVRENNIHLESERRRYSSLIKSVFEVQFSIWTQGLKTHMLKELNFNHSQKSMASTVLTNTSPRKLFSELNWMYYLYHTYVKENHFELFFRMDHVEAR